METPEDDEGIIATIYNRERKHLLDQHDNLYHRLNEIFPEFEGLFGETLEEFTNTHMKISLTKLKNKHYPKVKEVPSASTHLWIGVNPPKNKYNLLDLFNLTTQVIMKYKWAQIHAFAVESHTDGGYRPHVHMMVTSKEKPGRVIAALARHYCLPKPSIQCKAHQRGYLFGEHYDYIVYELLPPLQVCYSWR